MAEKQGSGRKHTKIGRKKRKPSQIMYTYEKRWEKNKRKKAQKTANRLNRIVKIKIDNEWETIKPLVKKASKSF